MPDQSPIGVDGIRHGNIARIRLDRPRALNALTLPMVQRISDLLEGWRSEGLRAVTIESSTDGVFCAGGDIRQIRQNTIDGNLIASDEFFAAEYRVNEMLASYPLPIIAIIDGVCMGGGLGLSAHGPFRVVTERALLAMPETAIGFFPDIGASHFLPRLPGAVGTYLGLTGARLDAADALEVGLATHHVASADLPALIRTLADDERPIDAVLRESASELPDEASIRAVRHRLDRAFTATSVEEITRRLAADDSAWAAETLAALRRSSPQSLRLTLDLLLWGTQRTLAECLSAERDAARFVVRSPDFLEGVRAALVDKDRMPVWTASRYRGTSSSGVVTWMSDSSEGDHDAVA